MALTRVGLVLSVPIAVLGHTGSTNTRFNFSGLDFSIRTRIYLPKARTRGTSFHPSPLQQMTYLALSTPAFETFYCTLDALTFDLLQ